MSIGTDSQDFHVEPASMARVDLPAGSFDAFAAAGFNRPFPFHFHETFAIGVIEAGAATIHTNRGSWTAEAGAILAFSPGEIHSAIPVHSSGYSYRMIYPEAAMMHELGVYNATLAQSGAPLFRAPVIDAPRLGFDLAAIHRPLMSGERHADLESRFVASMRALVAEFSERARTENASRAADVEIVAAARRHLRAMCGERITIGDVASVCGVSPFHLIRVFRRVVGVTPHAYLVQLRVNRAQAMLCRGTRAADVAYSCGFSDQSHLTRTFKSVIGVPPVEYARSVRNQAA